LVSYLGRTKALCVLCDPYDPHPCVCVLVCIKQGEKRKKVYKSGDDDQNAL